MKSALTCGNLHCCLAIVFLRVALCEKENRNSIFILVIYTCQQKKKKESFSGNSDSEYLVLLRRPMLPSIFFIFVCICDCSTVSGSSVGTCIQINHLRVLDSSVRLLLQKRSQSLGGQIVYPFKG